MSSLFRASRDSDEDSVLGSKRKVKSLYPSHYVASTLKGESMYGLSQVEIDRLDLVNSNANTFLLDTFAKLFDQGHFDEYYFGKLPFSFYLSPKNWCRCLSLKCLLCIPLAPLLFTRKFLCSRKSEGLVISIFVSFLIIILGLIIGLISLIAMIPRMMLNFLLRRTLKTLVVHGYGLRLLKYLHIDVTNLVSKVTYQEKFWHSRFIDLRVDLYAKANEKVSIFIIPQLADNYAFLLVDVSRLECAIIDCADADSVLFAIAQIQNRYFGDAQLKINALLSTHKHWDHTAGNRGLLKKVEGLRIYGHYMDKVDCCTDFVKDRDLIHVSDNLTFEVISTPCHTLGSVCFKVSDVTNKSYIFTGDTIFHGACGAPFEGKEQLMRRNFALILSRSSRESFLFPAHEYSVPLLDKLLKKANSKSPFQYLSLASQYYVALHRRTLRRGDELPHIPIRLDVEMSVNPIFLKIDDNLKFITRALRALATNNNFELAHESQFLSELTLQTSPRPLPDRGSHNYLIDYESLQHPFVYFYRTDFNRFIEDIRRGDLVDLEEKVKGLNERMMKVPTRKKLSEKNVFLTKEIEELDTDAKEIEYLRGRLEGFTEIRRILEDVFNYPMQEYMLERLDNKEIRKRILKQRKPMKDDWVKKDFFIEAMAKIDPNNRDIINEFLWREGQFVPLIPLAMKIAGFEDADDLKAVNERLKFVKKQYLEENGEKLRKKQAKSDANLKVKQKGKKVCCSCIGCCKIRIPDLSLESELELPKHDYDLEACHLLRDSYIRGGNLISTEEPIVQVQEISRDDIV